MQPFETAVSTPGRASLVLRGDDAGEGPPLVLLHGLTATRRNVVQGSNQLVRRGYRLIGYDARGHGESDPAPRPDEYEYADMVRDLDAVLAHLGLERPVLVGSSMGAATALTWALTRQNEVRALVQITPAYDGSPRTRPEQLQAWRRMSDGLAEGGIDGFVAAAGLDLLPERWRGPAEQAVRQRLARHRDLKAVADALRVVPGSPAFEGLDLLESLELPTLVVGTRDEADPLHPLELAREYAERLPRGELAVEEPGDTPLAWQGARLSRAIGDFLERVP